jgi:hypothetical protein
MGKRYFTWLVRIVQSSAQIAEMKIHHAEVKMTMAGGREKLIPLCGAASQGRTTERGFYHSAKLPSLCRQIGLRQRWPTSARCLTYSSLISMPSPGPCGILT